MDSIDDLSVVEVKNGEVESRECLLARITDFAISSIQKSINNARIAGHKPRIQIHVDNDGKNGIFKISTRDGEDPILIRWSLQSACSTGKPKPAIIDSHSSSALSIGDVTNKITILATDSTFSEAGQKQKKLIEESLEKQSKIEIQRPSSKHFNTKPKPVPSRPSAGKPISKPLMTPADRVKSHQLSKAPVPKIQPVTSDAHKETKEPLRHRIIHILAGVTRSKTEIWNQLQTEGGIGGKDMEMFDSIINEIAVSTSHDKLRLNDEILTKEVDINYKGWDELQKRQVQKELKQKESTDQKSNLSKSAVSDAIGVRATNSPRPPMIKPKNKKPKSTEPVAPKVEPDADANKEEIKPAVSKAKTMKKAAKAEDEALVEAFNKYLDDEKLYEPDVSYQQKYGNIATFEEYQRRHAEYQSIHEEYSALYDMLSDFKNELVDVYNRFANHEATAEEKQKLMYETLDRLKEKTKNEDLKAKRQKFVNIKAQMAAIKNRLTQFQQRAAETPITK